MIDLCFRDEHGDPLERWQIALADAPNSNLKLRHQITSALAPSNFVLTNPEVLRETRADVHDWMIKVMPVMPPKAYRWVPEMLQIAETLEGVGMTPRIFQGAADMYDMVAGTTLGKQTPESRDKSVDGREVIRRLADER
mgnify:CR=1 FL=1